jgi:hypothetical protein
LFACFFACLIYGDQFLASLSSAYIARELCGLGTAARRMNFKVLLTLIHPTCQQQAHTQPTNPTQQSIG